MDEKKKQGTLNGDTKNENGGHKNDELKNPAIHLENKRKINSLVTIKTPV